MLSREQLVKAQDAYALAKTQLTAQLNSVAGAHQAVCKLIEAWDAAEAESKALQKRDADFTDPPSGEAA